MEILDLQQGTQEWVEAREGKITGTKLKDIIVKRGTARKIGFYQLMADKLVHGESHEDPMERGSRLESEAIEMFQKESGLEVVTGLFCVHETYEGIALSPDGLIGSRGIYTQAVEVKCLSSARHLQAYFEQEVPKEHMDQVIQYFIVNNDLELLYFVMYDPRIPALPYHVITVSRDEIEDKIESYFEYQVKVLSEIDAMINSLLVKI